MFIFLLSDYTGKDKLYKKVVLLNLFLIISVERNSEMTVNEVIGSTESWLRKTTSSLPQCISMRGYCTYHHKSWKCNVYNKQTFF